MATERGLRIVTLLASALATPFLIAITIISLENRYRHYWYYRVEVTPTCFGFIPLALTAGASTTSLLIHRKRGRMPDFRFNLLDIIASAAYIAILIPIWALDINRLYGSANGLVAGYATAPMILNMVVHFYFSFHNAKPLAKWLFSKSQSECPHCHHKLNVSEPQVQETTRGGAKYSLLRGEEYLDVDEDVEAISGLRSSEESNAVDGAPNASNADLKGKGAIMI